MIKTSASLRVEVQDSKAGLLQRIRDFVSLDGAFIEIGIQGTEAADGEVDPSSLPGIAATLHFGSPENNIAPRPWMEATVDKHSREWAAGFRKAAEEGAKGNKEEAEKRLRVIGVIAVGDMQQMLREGNWTANTPSTVKSKWEKAGRPGPLDSFKSQPLIDTGQLVQSHRAALVRNGRREIIG